MTEFENQLRITCITVQDPFEYSIVLHRYQIHLPTCSSAFPFFRLVSFPPDALSVSNTVHLGKNARPCLRCLWSDSCPQPGVTPTSWLILCVASFWPFTFAQLARVGPPAVGGSQRAERFFLMIVIIVVWIMIDGGQSLSNDRFSHGSTRMSLDTENRVRSY